MNIPRLLPLIGVSVIGVLAINLVGGARDLPEMLSAARAYAEGVAQPETKPAKGAKARKSDSEKPAPAPQGASVLPPPTAAAVPAGVCAPGAAELARSAGLSGAEMQVLESLQARRGQIDARFKDIDTQTQLLAVAEAKLDAKLKAMSDLKHQIEGLMGQADQKTQGEVDRLTVVYSKMKPQDAAAVMATLDDKVRVPIAASMKPAILSQILGKMAPADAKKLTELLAHRFAPVQQLADAAKAPTSAQPAAPASPTKADAKTAKAAKPTPPAQTAEAEPGDANVDEAKPAPKPKARPRQIARRAPAGKPVYKAPAAKKPVEEAKASSGPHPYSEVKDAPAKPVDKPIAPAAAPAKT